MPLMQRRTALALSIAAAALLATAPAQAQQGGSAVYATIFTSSNVAIEPQLNFTAIRAGGETVTSLGFAGRVKYFFKGPSVNSAYVVGDGAPARAFKEWSATVAA